MTAGGPPRYQILPPDRPADEVERELLARWQAENLFQKTLDANVDGPSFVFFEGPPTANGRPGIHHVFARTVKDLFCRYRAMKGMRVARKAGWDTHGLPVEIEVEKQLGISGKQQIEAVGVAEFNRLCRESVFRYREEWERLSARIGYWLDYEHPYVTFTNDYVESVWWALKTCSIADTRFCRTAPGAEQRCRATSSRSGMRTSKIRASTSRSISRKEIGAFSSGRRRRGR